MRNANHELYARARALRKNMTPEELSLYINYFKFEGIRVRRQEPIGCYIVDFLVPDKKLIIELDGNEHFSYNGMLYDKKRDEILKSLGYTVLRFENEQVRNNFSRVCEKIDAAQKIATNNS